MSLEEKRCIIREAQENQNRRSTVYIPVSDTKLIGVIGIDVAEGGTDNESAQHLTDRTNFDSLLRQYLSNLGSALHHFFLNNLSFHESPTAAKLFLLQSRVDQLTDELNYY